MFLNLFFCKENEQDVEYSLVQLKHFDPRFVVGDSFSEICQMPSSESYSQYLYLIGEESQKSQYRGEMEEFIEFFQEDYHKLTNNGWSPYWSLTED